jgi:hypothetical protein
MKLGLTMTVPTALAGGMQVFILAVGKVVRVEKRREDGVQSVCIAAALRRCEYFRNGLSDTSVQRLSSLLRSLAQWRIRQGLEFLGLAEFWVQNELPDSGINLHGGLVMWWLVWKVIEITGPVDCYGIYLAQIGKGSQQHFVMGSARKRRIIYSH